MGRSCLPLLHASGYHVWNPNSASCSTAFIIKKGVALLYPNGTAILPNGVRVNIPYDPMFNTSIAIWDG